MITLAFRLAGVGGGRMISHLHFLAVYISIQALELYSRGANSQVEKGALSPPKIERQSRFRISNEVE